MTCRRLFPDFGVHLAIWLLWGAYGGGNSVGGAGDRCWNPDSARGSLGSKVKAGLGAMPLSFIKCLLSTYYVPGPLSSTGSTDEFPFHGSEFVIK